MADELNPDAMSDEEFEVFMNQANVEGEVVDTEEEVDTIEEEEVEELDTAEDDQDDSEEIDTEEVEEDDSEEEEEEDTEQSEDDANVDDSDDDDTEDDESEDDEEEESDQSPASDDTEQTTETENDTSTDEEVKVQTYKFKSNGMDFEFTADEMKSMMPKAMDYTKKLQQMAPQRKRISAMEDLGMTDEEFNLMLDVHKGDKAALTTMLKKQGVDALDIDTEADVNYQPKDYGRNETELAIDEVVEHISVDDEYTVTKHIVDKQWDSKSREAFVNNPQKIAMLHEDVKSGVYDAVAPQAMKLKALDGGLKSDIEYYQAAGRQYFETMRAQEAMKVEATKADEARKAEQVKVDAAKQKRMKQTTVKKTAKKRKAAATTKTGGNKKLVTDYLDSDTLSDEEFSKLMEKQINKG